jgi:GNAT superfamily N-acetyltransferase
MSDVSVAVVTAGDARDLAELIQDMDRFYGDASGYCIDDATRAVRANLVECNARGALIARMGSAPVGLLIHAALWPTVDLKPALFVKDIYVLEQARGRGVGRALLRHLAIMARRDGYSRIDWTTERDNADARTAYARLGVPVLEEKMFYRLQGGALEPLANSG